MAQPLWDFGEGNPADEELCQARGGHLLKPVAQLAAHAHADVLIQQLEVQDEVAPSRGVERLLQQCVHLQHLDAIAAQLGDELRVVPLGLVDPHDVVEKQCFTVARSQPLVSQSRCAHHDLAERARLGPDAQWRSCHLSEPLCARWIPPSNAVNRATERWLV